MAGKLRAVPEGETAPAPPPKPKTIIEAAEDGTRRDLLVALRSRIARTVHASDTPARDLAALSRRLLEISKEIEALDAEEEGDDISHAAGTKDEPWDASAI